MEKESIDYSVQARTNPVFMTAKTAVCLMAQAGIPDAAEIVHKVRILEPETHMLYRDRRMFLEKTAPDQIKPIRVLDTQRNKEFFMALSEE